MNILVIGGTRFFGIPMIKALDRDGHNITIATRGQTAEITKQELLRIISMVSV